jgi:hypothetical protein
MVLSMEERVFLVEYVFREGNRHTYLVQEKFAEKFPQTPVPHRNAFRGFIEKFRETDVFDAERSWRPSKLNDKKLMDISDSVLRSPSKPLRKLAQDVDIGLATAHKVVRKQICRKCLRIKLNGFRAVKTLVDNTFNNLCKCTPTFRTHCML